MTWIAGCDCPQCEFQQEKADAKKEAQENVTRLKDGTPVYHHATEPLPPLAIDKSGF